jgi:hypothetical protein
LIKYRIYFWILDDKLLLIMILLRLKLMDRRVFISDDKFIRRRMDSLFNNYIKNNRDIKIIDYHRSFYKIHHSSININPISLYIDNIFYFIIILDRIFRK